MKEVAYCAISWCVCWFIIRAFLLLLHCSYSLIQKTKWVPVYATLLSLYSYLQLFSLDYQIQDVPAIWVIWLGNKKFILLWVLFMVPFLDWRNLPWINRHYLRKWRDSVGDVIGAPVFQSHQLDVGFHFSNCLKT